MQPATVPGDRIVEAIRTLLERNLGQTSARAVDYYADSRVASRDPAEYTKTLLAIFGAGTGHVLAALVAGLGEEFGVEVHEGTTLDELIRALRPRAEAK